MCECEDLTIGKTKESRLCDPLPSCCHFLGFNNPILGYCTQCQEIAHLRKKLVGASTLLILHDGVLRLLVASSNKGIHISFTLALS